MVVTRAKSTVTLPVTQTLLNEVKHLDDTSESLVVELCSQLNRLTSNYSDIQFDDLTLTISGLVKNLDRSIALGQQYESSNIQLQLENDALESRIEQEVRKRQRDLNESFNESLHLLEEKDAILRSNTDMSSKLATLKSKLKLCEEECSSFKIKISDKDNIIDSLNNSLNECQKQNSELLNIINCLKAKLQDTEAKSWHNSRWLDDRIIDTYFDNFTRNNTNDTKNILFLGPTISQLIKHGSYEDVKAQLDAVSFTSSDYAFLCVNNNPAELKQDSGCHWSLLFVDIVQNKSFHLDSLSGSNSKHARLITNKLSIDDGNFIEVSCNQQNNSYECGLNVLINCKLIYQAFCKGSVPARVSFLEWYQRFHAEPHGQLLKSNREGTSNCLDGSTIGNCVGEVDGSSETCGFTDNTCLESDPALDNLVQMKWEKVKSKKTRSHKKANKPSKNKNNHAFFPKDNTTGVNSKNRFDVLKMKKHPETIRTVVIRNGSGLWRERERIRNPKLTTVVNTENVDIERNRISQLKDVQLVNNNTLVLEDNFNMYNENMSTLVSKKVEPVNSNALDLEDINSNENMSMSLNKKALSEGVRTLGSSEHDTPMGGVLLIGDSILRHSGKRCAKSGAVLDVNPGAKIAHIKNKLASYVNNHPDIIYLLVGTNDLVHGYNGGPGYNGGWGKRTALHSMADLLSTARRQFPQSRVVLNSVICRRDINKKALIHFNDQLDSMCNNFGVHFADANLAIGKAHLARDGRHLNRQGNTFLGDFIFHYISQVKENQQGLAYVGLMSLGTMDSASSYSISSPVSGNGCCSLPLSQG